MRLTRILAGLAGVIVLTSLWGCMYSAKVTVNTPIASGLSKYDTVLVQVTTLVMDTQDEVSELEKTLVSQLEKNKMFKEIIPGSLSPAASSELRITVKILAMKKVGLGRAFLGGRASIAADIIIVDVKTEDTIGNIEISHKPRSSTTADVIVDLSKKIAELVKEAY